jgi:hypothetical protein
MVPYIRNEESSFHFYLLFLLFLASPEELWKGEVRVAVILCTFIPGYFSILLVFFSHFFCRIHPNRHLEYEKDMASQLCRNSGWRCYIYVFILLNLLNITQIQTFCLQKWPKRITTQLRKPSSKKADFFFRPRWWFWIKCPETCPTLGE